MGRITEAQLKNELKSGSLSRVYFLYGEEDFLVKTYADRIVDIAVPEEVRDMNFIRFTDAPRSAELMDYLDGMPVFAEYKCALIMDLDLEQLDAAEQKNYLALLKNIPESSVLIIEQLHINANDYNDKKIKEKPKKLLEAANKNGAVCEFKYLSLDRVCTQIRRKVERGGCTISDENAAFLAEECGRSLTVLGHEIDKLCAYRQSGEITKDDLNALVPKRADAGIYTLADALFEGRTKDAFEILDELFVQQFDEHKIFFALSGYFVDLYRAKLGKTAGKNYSETAQAFGYYGGRSYAMKYAYPKAAMLSERYLGDCLTVLYRTNRLLNSSKMSDRTLIESAVAELSMLKKTDD
ncbi:MAG: DNA polymerase III subunit delta [Oscillospiraceae bacterium]|nr:DNA polymerase III subunit delta [Oscillospiraceae bacterium]